MKLKVIRLISRLWFLHKENRLKPTGAFKIEPIDRTNSFYILCQPVKTRS